MEILPRTPGCWADDRGSAGAAAWYDRSVDTIVAADQRPPAVRRAVLVRAMQRVGVEEHRIAGLQFARHHGEACDACGWDDVLAYAGDGHEAFGLA
jgi:hypothetical protein